MGEYLQISEHNRLIVTTEDGLKAAVMSVMQEMGFNVPTPAESKVIATEVPTKLAKQMLKEKGYRVKSCQAFKKVIDDNKVVPERKGKDDWYQVSALDRIPAKA